MHIRHKRTLAAIAALSVTTPALLALTVESASAGTSAGLITCTQPAGNAARHAGRPVRHGFTATPPATIAPSTSAAYSLTGIVTVTVPGAVAAGSLTRPARLGVGFLGGKFALDATHTTGSLTSPILPAPAPQTITGYTPDPDGAGPGTSNANDITFAFPGSTFSGATVNAAHGQTIESRWRRTRPPAAWRSLWRPRASTSAGVPLAWAARSSERPLVPAPALGPPTRRSDRLAVVDPTPVVTVSGSYGAVAGISNALSVGVTDAGGSAPNGGSWAISSGPTCTGAGGDGSASISGNASGATVTFDAPNNAATCTIGVTVADGNTTSSEAVLNVNVAAGDSLQQDVTQVVNPGVLDLLACGVIDARTRPPARSP